MIKIKIQRSTALVSAQHRLHDIGEEFLGAVFETTYRLLHTMGGGRYAALKYDDISLHDSSFLSLKEIFFTLSSHGREKCLPCTTWHNPSISEPSIDLLTLYFLFLGCAFFHSTHHSAMHVMSVESVEVSLHISSPATSVHVRPKLHVENLSSPTSTMDLHSFQH